MPVAARRSGSSSTRGTCGTRRPCSTTSADTSTGSPASTSRTCGGRTRSWCDRVLPGDGVADVPALIGALDAAGWDGLYDLEIFSDNGTFGTHHPDSLWDVPAAELARRGRAATARRVGDCATARPGRSTTTTQGGRMRLARVLSVTLVASAVAVLCVTGVTSAAKSTKAAGLADRDRRGDRPDQEHGAVRRACADCGADRDQEDQRRRRRRRASARAQVPEHPARPAGRPSRTRRS